MPGRNRNLKSPRSLWIVLCFLCCALITLSGIVQAGHIHADGQAIQTDCALCHVAHLVVQPAALQAAPRPVRVMAEVSAAPQPRSAHIFFVFSLFTRPPPSALTA